MLKPVMTVKYKYQAGGNLIRHLKQLTEIPVLKQSKTDFLNIKRYTIQERVKQPLPKAILQPLQIKTETLKKRALLNSTTKVNSLLQNMTVTIMLRVKPLKKQKKALKQ